MGVSSSSSSSSEWYVLGQDGVHRGPLSSEEIAAAIVAGEIARDSLIAMNAWFESEPGASGWSRADTVTEIAQLLFAKAQRAVRSAAAAAAVMKRDSTAPVLHVVDGVHRYDHRGTPDFSGTVMMVTDEDAKKG